MQSARGFYSLNICLHTFVYLAYLLTYYIVSYECHTKQLTKPHFLVLELHQADTTHSFPRNDVP